MDNEANGEMSIHTEGDIVSTRRVVRDATTRLGFGVTDVTRVVTAASELARNIYLYAGSGLMRSRSLDGNKGVGIELIFEDAGPGIADIQQATKEGFSTGGGLGMGLPGTKRLMDEMEIQSEPGKGTTITVRKWRRR